MAITLNINGKSHVFQGTSKRFEGAPVNRNGITTTRAGGVRWVGANGSDTASSGRGWGPGPTTPARSGGTG